MKLILIVSSGSFIILLIFFSIFLGYALLPAVSETTLPESGLLTFNINPLPDDEEFKVVTYNIGYASRLKNNREPVSRKEVETNLKDMARALLPLNVDVICLQEVDFRAERTYNINQLEYLAEELHLPYTAYVILWNKRYIPWPYWPPSYHFGRVVSGQAILSRYRITDHTLHRFNKPKEHPFWYNWFYLERVTQGIHFSLNGKSVALWNVHLEAKQELTRKIQTEILAHEVIKNRREIVIVAGDFNSASSFQENEFAASERVSLKNSRNFLESFSQTTGLKNAEGQEPLYSYSSARPIKKIDHIFFNNGLILKNVENLQLTASDHLPLFASLKFTE